MYARQSYWCIVKTIASTGVHTAPYHAYVPSFGEWGFVIGGRAPYRLPSSLPSDLRFLTVAGVPELFRFGLEGSAWERL